MKNLFGTDGIRGKANIYPMTAEVALKVGMAAGIIFRNGNRRTKVVIGKDTRASGYMIEYAITAGLVSMGADVLLVGPMPTPAIAHLTKSFAADAGIVISASHNPAEDNGIKFFDKNGYKLSSEFERQIEKLALLNNFDTSKIIEDKVGKAKRIDDAAGRYIEFAKGSIQNQSLKGIKLVLDCANGAAYKIAPLIFEELGAEVIVVNNTPDGLNINKNAGSLHPMLLIDNVRKNSANLGVALDGDADRVILVDEKGEIVDGDEILAICASFMLENQMLENKVVVSTVMSNLGLELSLKKLGIELLRTDVGDKYVAEMMRQKKALIGGEQSGHIIFSNYSTTGDGVIAALQVLNVMQKTGKSLSVLKKTMAKLPQTLVNVKVKERKPIEKMPKTRKAIKDAEAKLGKNGRVLVRYSGTENKCRVMVEGKSQKEIEAAAKTIADSIRQEIGK